MRVTLTRIVSLMPDEPYALLSKLARSIGRASDMTDAMWTGPFGPDRDEMNGRWVAATECLGDLLRPLIAHMPVPFDRDSMQPSHVLVRVRIDVVHQFCEARVCLHTELALQTVLCPQCGQRTSHVNCERCDHPLHEVKVAWAAAYS